MRDQLRLRHMPLYGIGDLEADTLDGAYRYPQQIEPQIELGEHHGVAEMRERDMHVLDGAVDQMPWLVAQSRDQHHEIAQRPAVLVMRRRPLAQRLGTGMELDGDAGQVHGSGTGSNVPDQ